ITTRLYTLLPYTTLFRSIVGVDQIVPFGAFRHHRQRKVHDVEVSVVNQQKRRIRTTTLDSTFLGPSIENNPETACVGILPLLRGDRKSTRLNSSHGST